MTQSAVCMSHVSIHVFDFSFLVSSAQTQHVPRPVVEAFSRAVAAEFRCQTFAVYRQPATPVEPFPAEIQTAASEEVEQRCRLRRREKSRECILLIPFDPGLTIL